MKDTKVSLTVDKETRQLWNKATDNLIKKKLFRNKTEVFENIVFFLSHAPEKELWDFRDKITNILRTQKSDL